MARSDPPPFFVIVTNRPDVGRWIGRAYPGNKVPDQAMDYLQGLIDDLYRHGAEPTSDVLLKAFVRGRPKLVEAIGQDALKSLIQAIIQYR